MPEPLSDHEIEERFGPLFESFYEAIHADPLTVVGLVEAAARVERSRERVARATETMNARRAAERAEAERRDSRRQYQRDYQREYQRRRREQIAADPERRERERARQREYARKWRARRREMAVGADT